MPCFSLLGDAVLACAHPPDHGLRDDPHVDQKEQADGSVGGQDYDIHNRIATDGFAVAPGERLVDWPSIGVLNVPLHVPDMKLRQD